MRSVTLWVCYHHVCSAAWEVLPTGLEEIQLTTMIPQCSRSIYYVGDIVLGTWAVSGDKDRRVSLRPHVKEDGPRK